MLDYNINNKILLDKIVGKTFLVTGGAGFIGSHIVECLIMNDAKNVTILDDLSTGFFSNISNLKNHNNFNFIEGNICDYELVYKITKDIDYVIHLAALGSVPRSINDPLLTNKVNIEGHLNILNASRINNVKRLVYAASSSTYGDSTILPKKEENIGKPLSPYAVTKYVNELYSDVFYKCYGFETIGLRYFNVFGPRQNPNGQYSAVIPLFFNAVLKNENVFINGDGNQTRDFTFVDNVIIANLKALFVENLDAVNQVYNVACGERTSLNLLFKYIKEITNNEKIMPIYRENRVGDVRDSLADLSKIENLLCYKPIVFLKEGLSKSLKFYNRINE